MIKQTRRRLAALRFPRVSRGAESLLTLLALVAAVMLGPAQGQDAADKTILDIEILSPAFTIDPLSAQRWRQAFEQLGEGVRIRQPLGGDKVEVTEKTQGPFRVVKAVGQLKRDGQIAFAGREFGFDDLDKLKEWLNELKVYGALGSPDGKPLWGLTNAQFELLLSQLSQPVPETVKGMPFPKALEVLPLNREIPLKVHSSAAEQMQQHDEAAVMEELRGLSAGTALAYLLHQRGLAFQPLRTPEGKLQLVVEPLKNLENPWPIGWPVGEATPRNEIVPPLFKLVTTGFESGRLAEVIDAIETQSGATILVDHAGCRERGIDLHETLVTFPRKKTAWAVILSSAVRQSRLTIHYRQDESGAGLVLIEPFTPHVPGRQ